MNAYQRQLYCLFVIFNFLVLQNIILISYAKPSPTRWESESESSQAIGSNEVIDLRTGRSYTISPSHKSRYDSYSYSDSSSISDSSSNEVIESNTIPTAQDFAAQDFDSGFDSDSGFVSDSRSDEVIDPTPTPIYSAPSDESSFESSFESSSEEASMSREPDSDSSQTLGSNEVIELPPSPITTTERIRTGYVYRFNLGVQEADSDESNERSTMDPNIIRYTGNSRHPRAVVSNELGYWNEKFEQMKSYLTNPVILLVGIVACSAVLGIVQTLRSKNAQRIKDELKKTNTEGELKKTNTEDELKKNDNRV